jgi:carboxyl-terminal processing protease
LYYTPSGRSIQAQGIEPDIKVEEAFITKRSRSVAEYSESDLPGRLDNGNADATASEMAEVLISAEEVLVTDYPLNEAINVLKGINAFKPAKARANPGAFAQREN